MSEKGRPGRLAPPYTNVIKNLVLTIFVFFTVPNPAFADTVVGKAIGYALVFFVMDFVCGLCLAMATKNIVMAGGLALVLHRVGVVGCKKDDYFFDILFGRLKLACPNRKTGGA